MATTVSLAGVSFHYITDKTSKAVEEYVKTKTPNLVNSVGSCLIANNASVSSDVAVQGNDTVGAALLAAVQAVKPTEATATNKHIFAVFYNSDVLESLGSEDCKNAVRSLGEYEDKAEGRQFALVVFNMSTEEEVKKHFDDADNEWHKEFELDDVTKTVHIGAADDGTKKPEDLTKIFQEALAEDNNA